MSPMYVEKLISQMKPRPALWDLRNYNYNNRTLCDREWSEMAAALNTEKDVVKAKWKSLRDTYRRELRKAKLGQKSRWVHFSRMSFLKDALEARDRRRAAADTTTTEDSIMSPPHKWYADPEGSFCAEESAVVGVLQQGGDGTQDTEEENFPVIKEPEVQLTMDDISIIGYEQRSAWMDEDNLADNPRKMFLLSLLPDLEQMSEPQMRLFKKSVLELTCQILDSNNDTLLHTSVHLGDAQEESNSGN